MSYLSNATRLLMAIITDLPLEILCTVIAFAFPLAHEFDEQLDEPHANPFLVVDRRAPRAACAQYALVCRALYYAAIPIMWEHVVLDTYERLDGVAAAFANGFHHLPLKPCTRRLALRLPPHYTLSKVNNVLQAMSGLTVLVVANRGSSDGSSVVRKSFLNIIRRSLPSLLRLQIMNDCESLSLRQLGEIAQSVPRLQTLVAYEVLPYRSSMADPQPPLPFFNLTTLSVGKSAGPPDGISHRLIQALLHNALPSIQRLDILDCPTNLADLLRRRGPQLRHLTMHSTNPFLARMRRLFSMCPNLETFTIVVGAWNTAWRWPTENASILRINLVQPTPFHRGPMDVLLLLRSLRNVQFPNLHTVYLYFDSDFYYEYRQDRLASAVGNHHLLCDFIVWPE